jgi:methyl-accepting chemotaxis protein
MRADKKSVGREIMADGSFLPPTRALTTETEAAIGELAREVGSLGVAFADVAGHVEDVSGRISHQVSVLDDLRGEAAVMSAGTGNVNAAAAAARAVTARAQDQVASGRGQVDNALSGLRTLTEDVTAIEKQSGDLTEALNRVGRVANEISAIAKQTNLLALNATIEAARAGQAGRGFAVVAQEVKALADQTTRATGEIDQRVGAIRAMTRDVTGMVGGIAASIEGLQEISHSIASSVEEQGAVTSHISASLSKAAAGTSSVMAEIAELPAAAGETGRIARELELVAASLAQDSGDLRSSVDDLLRRLAA